MRGRGEESTTERGGGEGEGPETRGRERGLGEGGGGEEGGVEGRGEEALGGGEEGRARGGEGGERAPDAVCHRCDLFYDLRREMSVSARCRV